MGTQITIENVTQIHTSIFAWLLWHLSLINKLEWRAHLTDRNCPRQQT
jgi:hypothetical protein